jgi:hypothetical protein
MRAMGSGQLGISAAGIIAPLRSSDYGTLHSDYTADQGNRSSLAGEAMPASWGRHRRWQAGKAAAGPGVAATAEEPGEDDPVSEPAAGNLIEEDSAAGEPQFWLSPLPEAQQRGYSYESSNGSVSASTAAECVQPVLFEGLSQWPSSVFQPGDYGYAPSRQGSESFAAAAAAAAAEPERQGHLQQHEMGEDAAGAQQQWQQQQQMTQQLMSAQVQQQLLRLEEASEGDSEGVQQHQPEETARRGSAAGAAVAAAGAAASAALGGLKNMLGEPLLPPLLRRLCLVTVLMMTCTGASLRVPRQSTVIVFQLRICACMSSALHAQYSSFLLDMSTFLWSVHLAFNGCLATTAADLVLCYALSAVPCCSLCW